MNEDRVRQMMVEYDSIDHSRRRLFEATCKHIDPMGCGQMNRLLDLYSDAYRPLHGYNIVVVPQLMQKLGMDPAKVHQNLIDKYPLRRGSDPIERGGVQWVAGDHETLKYRGNELAREKMWFQRNEMWGKSAAASKIAYYYYTGVQWAVVNAQSCWNKCPEILGVMNNMDRLYEQLNVPYANHAIVTRYRHEIKSGIGAHFDKPQSIDFNSLITVLKTGPTGRTFDLYEGERKGARSERSFPQTPTWSRVLNPGDALIMTLDANCETKHGVPTDDPARCGDAGSIVLRTVSEVTCQEVEKRQGASERAKQKAREKKMALKAVGKAPAAAGAPKRTLVRELDSSDDEREDKAADHAASSSADACSDWEKGPQTAPYFSSEDD